MRADCRVPQSFRKAVCEVDVAIGAVVHRNMSFQFNGVIATNLLTDAQGAFQIGLFNDRGELPLPTQPDGSAHIEEFVDIDIVDVHTNSVLSLTLP